jgi:hypothetical protein
MSRRLYLWKVPFFGVQDYARERKFRERLVMGSRISCAHHFRGGAHLDRRHSGRRTGYRTDEATQDQLNFNVRFAALSNSFVCWLVPLLLQGS